MYIVICASIEFTPKIQEVAEALRVIGHSVDIPLTSEKILKGELTLEAFKKEKAQEGSIRKIQHDVIRRYFKIIQNSDAILVLNFTKNGIENYIGGNTFLEMGFAHVLDKHIFLYNPIPTLSYTDEIRAMQPMVLYGNLSKTL